MKGLWLQWVADWYHRKQRQSDVAILWPAIKQQCADQGMTTLDHAKAAFALHCFKDRAWLVLGPDEIKRRIAELD